MALGFALALAMPIFVVISRLSIKRSWILSPKSPPITALVVVDEGFQTSLAVGIWLLKPNLVVNLFPLSRTLGLELRRIRRTSNRHPKLGLADAGLDTETSARAATGRTPQRSIPHCSPVKSQAAPATSSPCAWEKAISRLVGPIYGPEDLICGWVTKRKSKRKASFSLQWPAKRLVIDPGSRPNSSPEFSDADDKDDEN
ncbi:uncharacterized protein LY89DRAFT_744044 [Mollisia scopiformis]|uniref:Uncharacterized protein n=1 Tax=Mollisia scopiformis TaxID=149040 RepID=A0A132B3G9_MOLSC|nr:uncharacterized protein LY89DRAFT_744044 [Mollisia scopiformis]KUJ06207.1 hypothetical protein LY89DRAFT_744044 [Mollisia scopiformis]